MSEIEENLKRKSNKNSILIVGHQIRYQEKQK